MRKIDVSNLVGLEAFEGRTVHKKFIRESLKQRVEILMVKPFKGFEIYLPKLGVYL